MSQLPILALPMKAEQAEDSDTQPEKQAEDSDTEPEEQASPGPEPKQPEEFKGGYDQDFYTPANPARHRPTGTHPISQEGQPTPDPEPASPPPGEGVVVKQLFKK